MNSSILSMTVAYLVSQNIPITDDNIHSCYQAIESIMPIQGTEFENMSYMFKPCLPPFHVLDEPDMKLCNTELQKFETEEQLSEFFLSIQGVNIPEIEELLSSLDIPSHTLTDVSDLFLSSEAMTSFFNSEH
jgi:hypothetical protein